MTLYHKIITNVYVILARLLVFFPLKILIPYISKQNWPIYMCVYIYKSKQKVGKTTLWAQPTPKNNWCTVEEQRSGEGLVSLGAPINHLVYSSWISGFCMHCIYTYTYDRICSFFFFLLVLISIHHSPHSLCFFHPLNE